MAASSIAASLGKVTVVGVGQVGMACAVSMLTRHTCSNLVLVDANRDKLLGEVLDLQHAGAFLPGTIAAAGPDMAETAGSHVVVITAGVRQNVGESRRELLARNVSVFRSIVPPLARASPNAVFLVVSNPVDVMTYVTWRLSGLPAAQVLGSGTFLDTSRLRVLVAQRCGLSPMSVHATIIGEHGDASVPVWTGSTAGGIPLDAFPTTATADAPLPYARLHDEVKQCAGSVIRLKGYTNWAIGAAVDNIVRCVLHDERRAIPLSGNVRGFYGIADDVYLSLPAVVGQAGRERVLPPPLSAEEQAAFLASAATIGELHRTVDAILAETAPQQ